MSRFRVLLVVFLISGSRANSMTRIVTTRGVSSLLMLTSMALRAAVPAPAQTVAPAATKPAPRPDATAKPAAKPDGLPRPRELTVSPATIPVPAMKYRLLPSSAALNLGDAAPIYLRLRFQGNKQQ